MGFCLEYRHYFHYSDHRGYLTFCCQSVATFIYNLNPLKSKPVITRYRVVLKSSKSLENKGFIAVCVPYPFIRFHTRLSLP